MRRGFHRLSGAVAFVRRQIVEDDDVTFVQQGGELCFDVALKGVAIHGSIDHPWCDKAVMSQTGNECHGFPVTVRDGGNHPAAFAAAPPQARHLGVDPGFIDENDLADAILMDLKPGLTPPPDRPCRHDIMAILFTGVCGFF